MSMIPTNQFSNGITTDEYRALADDKDQPLFPRAIGGPLGAIIGGLSIMGILTLGAGQGTTILVSATGPDAARVVDALAALLADRFGEDE